MNIITSLSGEYRFVINREDGTTEDTGWFQNIILNQGLDRIGSDDSPVFYYCRLGTGTSTPAVTQTSLDSQVGVSTANSWAESAINSESPLYESLITYKFVFTQGAVVGNISEVGVGWEETGNTLFSRARILDNTSTPTTITLVSLDQVTVYYRVKIIPTLTDSVGSFLIGGTTYNYTSRVLKAGSFGATTQLFSGGFNVFAGIYYVYGYAAGVTLGALDDTGLNGTSISPWANLSSATPYTPGSYYRDQTITFDINSGNDPSGIQGFEFLYGYPYQSFSYQAVLDSPIPKTNTNVLTLTTRFSWARA